MVKLEVTRSEMVDRKPIARNVVQYRDPYPAARTKSKAKLSQFLHLRAERATVDYGKLYTYRGLKDMLTVY